MGLGIIFVNGSLGVTMNREVDETTQTRDPRGGYTRVRTTPYGTEEEILDVHII